MPPRCPQRASLIARLQDDVKGEWRKVTAPDGDPAPRAWFYRATGDLHRQDLPWQAFSSRQAKDELFARIAFLIRAGSVRYAGITTVVFSVAIPLGEEYEQARASRELPESVMQGISRLQEHPDAVEQQQVLALDAEIAKGFVAPVHRPAKRAPRLGAWAESRVDGGLMVDPLQKALR